MNSEILIPIVLFLSAATMIIFLRMFTYRERSAMIEKGVDPSNFVTKNKNMSSLVLVIGCLAIGSGMGIFIGHFLDVLFDMEAAGYFSMMFLFGGAGLVIGNVLARKQKD